MTLHRVFAVARSTSALIDPPQANILRLDFHARQGKARHRTGSTRQRSTRPCKGKVAQTARFLSLEIRKPGTRISSDRRLFSELHGVGRQPGRGKRLTPDLPLLVAAIDSHIENTRHLIVRLKTYRRQAPAFDNGLPALSDAITWMQGNSIGKGRRVPDAAKNDLLRL